MDFLCLAVNGRNLHLFLLNGGSPFKPGSSFLEEEDPKTPTRTGETTLDSTAAPVETINVCNSSAITLVNWNVLSFCVSCILDQRRSLSFICELSEHHF